VPQQRPAGAHRAYRCADVARLTERELIEPYADALLELSEEPHGIAKW
jgi:hypothetical protein